MANEFKHKDPGTELTQAEFIAACGDGHIFACQATGDIVYASSATVLSKLARGAANTVLSMGGSCIPAWTASPSVTDLTIGGGCITLSAATDIDLLDNNASALSFDATGKTGIIDIVTTNCSEGVTMSGTLGVTGVLTATGGIELSHACQNTLTGSGGVLSIQGNRIFHAGGTDIPVADGGTGASTFTANGILVGNGTSAIAVTATMATKGHLMVGDGSGVPSMLAVGNNCLVLTACSSEGTGVKWAAVSGGVTNVTGSCSAVVINECSGDVDFRVESNNNTEALVIDGAALGGIGNIGLGGAASDGAQVIVNHPATTIDSNSNIYNLYVGNSGAMTVASGTTSAIVASLRVNEPNISSSGATVTTAASVYIPGAPTEGASSYSLFIDEGNARFDGVIYAGNGLRTGPSYSFTCDTDIGMWRAGCDCLALVSGGVNAIRMNDHKVFMGNETANANTTRGLTITQAEFDNEIFTLKSSDINHGMTNYTETDTYFKIQKLAATGGGAELYGFGNGSANQGFRIQAINHATANTTKSASGHGVFDVISRQANGVTTQSVGADGNLVSFRDDGSARFLFDEDGEMHADGAVASAFDDYCDAQLSRALTLVSSMATKPCKSYSSPQSNKWDEFIRYNEQDLIDAKILGGPVHGVPDDERGLLNVTALQRLHNGAIWQLHSKLNDQAEELTALKGQLQALQEGK